MAQMTKADFLSEEQKAGLAKTPLGVPCTGCGAMLATELDFAAHFVILDARYLNLGECPETERGKQVQTLSWTIPIGHEKARGL